MSDTKNTFFKCSDIKPVLSSCCNFTFEEVKSVEKILEELWWMGTPVLIRTTGLESFEALKKPYASDFVLKASDKAFKPEKLQTHQIKFKLSN
jgi:hypothetical protein